jgi:hypothetical protein
VPGHLLSVSAIHSTPGIRSHGELLYIVFVWPNRCHLRICTFLVGDSRRFLINSKATEVDFDPRTSLLDLLRDHLGLPGSEGM